MLGVGAKCNELLIIYCIFLCFVFLILGEATYPPPPPPPLFTRTKGILRGGWTEWRRVVVLIFFFFFCEEGQDGGSRTLLGHAYFFICSEMYVFNKFFLQIFGAMWQPPLAPTPQPRGVPYSLFFFLIKILYIANLICI